MSLKTPKDYKRQSVTPHQTTVADFKRWQETGNFGWPYSIDSSPVITPVKENGKNKNVYRDRRNHAMQSGNC